jgi:hypothetical protein
MRIILVLTYWFASIISMQHASAPIKFTCQHPRTANSWSAQLSQLCGNIGDPVIMKSEGFPDISNLPSRIFYLEACPEGWHFALPRTFLRDRRLDLSRSLSPLHRSALDNLNLG